jgi:hypothetical protein
MAAKIFPRSIATPIGMLRLRATLWHDHSGPPPEWHLLIVPPTPAPSSSASQLASSSSTTYALPSGPNLRSTIEVNPRATTLQALLCPQRACRVPRSIRQMRDVPGVAGNPVSSVT